MSSVNKGAIRSLYVASVIALSCPAVVHAKPVVTHRSGVWETLEGTDDQGNQICSMGAEGNDRWILIKYTLGEPYLTFTIGKSNWHVVKNAKIKVELQVDNIDPWEAVATAADSKNIIFTIHYKQIAQFLREVSDGNNMRISFVEERENDWQASLDGSDDIATSFGSCVHRVTQSNGDNYE